MSESKLRFKVGDEVEIGVTVIKNGDERTTWRKEIPDAWRRAKINWVDSKARRSYAVSWEKPNGMWGRDCAHEKHVRPLTGAVEPNQKAGTMSESKPFENMMELYVYAQDGESWIRTTLGRPSHRWDKTQRKWVGPDGRTRSAPGDACNWCPCDPPPEPTEEVEVFANAYTLPDGKRFVGAHLTEKNALEVSATLQRHLRAYPTTIKLPASVARILRGGT